jgi:hypothetical protein
MDLIKLQIGESAVRPVTAVNFWNETGIELENGARYNLEVLPTDQVWMDGKLFKQVTNAEGFSNIIISMANHLKRARGEKWFALIGCIAKQETTFFRIGNSCKDYSPPVSGELVCFANDAEKHYANNKGTLFLTVTRVG